MNNALLVKLGRTCLCPLQAREFVLRLSSSECVLKREVEEGRDALEKMAALNSALASEKKELHKQLLEVTLLLYHWLGGS